jgi:hypothetical protein
LREAATLVIERVTNSLAPGAREPLSGDRLSQLRLSEAV